MMLTGATDAAFIIAMAAAVALFWITPPAYRTATLGLCTGVFLAVADPASLVLLVMFTIIVWVAAKQEGPERGTAQIGAIIAIVAALMAFKLFDPERGLFSGGNILIPLGLSFYALRCVHVLIERYLDEIPAPRPGDLVGYLFFTPTIVAGPIHRYPAFQGDAAPMTWTRASEGFERILYGYVQIAVISNFLLSAIVFPKLDRMAAGNEALLEYLDCLEFGLTLYFQFSGYSDIAIGLALLMNKQVMENFSQPLLRTSIADFWRSWHISLSSWCREYVFTGVYSMTRQRWIGVLATMLAIGLWHGVTLNFLLWGAYHGLGIVVAQWWAAKFPLSASETGAVPLLRRLGGWLLTVNFVMVGFIWTKEADITGSIDAFARLFGGMV